MCGAALTAHECLLNMMAAVHVLLLHEARLVCSGRLEVCGHSRRCAELREVGKDIDIERKSSLYKVYHLTLRNLGHGWNEFGNLFQFRILHL